MEVVSRTALQHVFPALAVPSGSDRTYGWHLQAITCVAIASTCDTV
jgi:hypothetical protein